MKPTETYNVNSICKNIKIPCTHTNMVSVEVELTKDGELVYRHGLRERVDKKNDHKKIIKSAVLLCGRLPDGYYQFPIEDKIHLVNLNQDLFFY